MAEILLFHHAGGLTDGVQQFAQTLRDTGHTVHTPDLFDGRTFADVKDGVAYAQSIGEEVLGVRAVEIAAGLPGVDVLGGMSMGCAMATLALLNRGGRAAFFLYGAVDPAWFDASWPEGVPVQAHVTEHDPWREPHAEAPFRTFGELFVYPGEGHLFAEDGHPDYDEAAAALATHRLLEFLSAVDAR